jgi:hypothetical protein
MGIEVGPAHYTSMDGVESKNKKMVFFHEVVEEDKAASAREGRPIAKTRIFVKHFTPGDTLLEVDKPMKPEDAQKYPDQWKAFQEKRNQVIEGTAIEMWPQLSTTQVYEFKAMKIFTVEQLVNLPDQFAQRIQGFQQMRQKAQNFLKLAKDASLLEETARQNEAKNAEIEELKRQVKELTSLVQAQPVVRRGGRPKGSKNKPKADTLSGPDTSPAS